MSVAFVSNPRDAILAASKKFGRFMSRIVQHNGEGRDDGQVVDLPLPNRDFGFYTHRVRVLQKLLQSAPRGHQATDRLQELIRDQHELLNVNLSYPAIRVWTTRSALQRVLGDILSQILDTEGARSGAKWSKRYNLAAVEDSKGFVRVFDSFLSILTSSQLDWENPKFQVLMNAFDWEWEVSDPNRLADEGNSDDFKQQVNKFGEASHKLNTASDLPYEQVFESAIRLHRALANVTEQVLSYFGLKYSISRDSPKDHKLMDLGRASAHWIRLPQDTNLQAIINYLASCDLISYDDPTDLRFYIKEHGKFASYPEAVHFCKGTSWEELQCEDFTQDVQTIYKPQDGGAAVGPSDQLYIVNKSTPFSIVVLTGTKHGSDIGKLLELPGGGLPKLPQNFLQDEYGYPGMRFQYRSTKDKLHSAPIRHWFSQYSCEVRVYPPLDAVAGATLEV